MLEAQYIYIVSEQDHHQNYYLSCWAREADALSETKRLDGEYDHFYEPSYFYREPNRHIDHIYLVYCDCGNYCYSVCCWAWEDQAQREIERLNSLGNKNSIYKYQQMKINY